METLFQQIGIIIIGAAIAGLFAQLLRQPLLPAYVLAGIFLGPVTGIITNNAIIDGFSQLGIVFLLFLVGLEIDIGKLKPVTQVALVGGATQIFFIGAISYFIGQALGFSSSEALYTSLIVAMSSTMVVVKILSDRKELDTVHGRITVGVLLLQDIVAIAALVLLQGGEGIALWPLLALKVTLAFSVTVFVMEFVVRKLFVVAAALQELLLFFSLGICFFFVLLFWWEGLSLSIGAFVAGVILANCPYHLEIITKVRALRDFFAAVFFVSLGLQLSLPTMQIIFPLFVLMGLAVIVKPMLSIGIFSAFGYSKRPALLSSLALAQVSEFSLILAAQGRVLGHISESFFTMTVLLTVLTLSTTAYLFSFEPVLYRVMNPLLVLLEKCHLVQPPFMMLPKKKKWEVILCGFHRMGYLIYHGLKKHKAVVVIDYDPDMLLRAAQENIPFIYGDATDADVLSSAGAHSAKIVISTIPEASASLALLAHIKKINKKAQVIVTAHHYRDARKLYDAGAALVVLPHLLAGEYAKRMAASAFSSPAKIRREREQQTKELEFMRK